MIHDEHDEHLEKDLEPFEGHFTDVGDAEPEEPKWIIKDVLPVGLTFVGGPPKLSKKSTQVLSMAALVAGYTNTLFPPHMRQVQRKGPVMGFSAEASAGVIKHMLTKDMHTPDLKADAGILIADDPWLFRLDKPEGMSQLLFWLDGRRPSLMFMDPLKNFHSADEKDSAAMYAIVEPLRRWAIKNDSSIILVHHTKKLDDKDKRDYNEMDLRGTTALFGIADGLHIITPVDPDKHIVRIKATFKRGQGWERTIRLAAYQHRDRLASEVFDEVTEKVYEAYKIGGANMDEVAAQVHVAKGRVVECVEILVRNGLLVKDGKKVRVVK